MGMDSGKIPKINGSGKNKKSKKQRERYKLEMYQDEYLRQEMISHNNLLKSLLFRAKA